MLQQLPKPVRPTVSSQVKPLVKPKKATIKAPNAKPKTMPPGKKPPGDSKKKPTPTPPKSCHYFKFDIYPHNGEHLANGVILNVYLTKEKKGKYSIHTEDGQQFKFIHCSSLKKNLKKIKYPYTSRLKLNLLVYPKMRGTKIYAYHGVCLLKNDFTWNNHPIQNEVYNIHGIAVKSRLVVQRSRQHTPNKPKLDANAYKFYNSLSFSLEDKKFYSALAFRFKDRLILQELK